MSRFVVQVKLDKGEKNACTLAKVRILLELIENLRSPGDHS